MTEDNLNVKVKSLETVRKLEIMINYGKVKRCDTFAHLEW